MVELIFPYLICAIGMFTISISFPKIKAMTIGKLQEQGVVPKLKFKKDKAEIIYGAGPNVSLFFIGIAITIFGVFLIMNK